MAKSTGELNEAAQAALVMVERDNAFHDEKDKRILEQQRAYEGILERLKPAAEWESHLHPPLLNHAIETAMTMLLDDDLKFEITPTPLEYSGTTWQDAVDGAKANEALFERQMGLKGDRMSTEFMRPFVLNAAINRVAIAKTHWRNETREVKYLDVKSIFPMLGSFGPKRMTESTKTTTLFDGPVSEVVDLRDFYWPEAAISLDRARYAAHAIWMAPFELRKKVDEGIYDKAAVDMLLAPDANGGSAKTEVPQGNEIELDREKRGRKNGLYEVLEIWDVTTRKLHVIGGRRVLLEQMDWPFWHQRLPFVAMSLAPFPFSIQGLSLVEKLAPIQDAIWDLLNQTFDNNKLLNNAIVLMAADFDDPDSFEYAPGAVNTVDNPQQVQFWQPNVQLAQIAAPLMEKLESDLQNLAMGQPLSIPVSGRVTATEIATLSQIAQNAASKMKAQVTYAVQRIGQQRLELNQQFIRTTQHFIKPGPDGTSQPYSIPPHVFQGDYCFELKPSSDSAVRAERRAEAQSLMTLAIQAAPVFAMARIPLNLKAFMDKVLESFDIDNEDEFYSSMPQPAGGPQQPQGGPQPEGAGPGGEPVGVTGPNSISPAVSPSAQQSLSPAIFAARALASQGGLRGNQLPGAQ